MPTVPHDNLAFALSLSPALLSFSSGRFRSSTCVLQYLDLPYVISLVTGLQGFQSFQNLQICILQNKKNFFLVYLNNFPQVLQDVVLETWLGQQGSEERTHIRRPGEPSTLMEMRQEQQPAASAGAFYAAE